MNQSDLIIGIGADLTAYNKAIAQAAKTWDKATVAMSSKRVNLAVDTVQGLLKAEKAIKAKVDSISKATILRIHGELDEESMKAMMTKYESYSKKALVTISGYEKKAQAEKQDWILTKAKETGQKILQVEATIRTKQSAALKKDIEERMKWQEMKSTSLGKSIVLDEKKAMDKTTQNLKKAILEREAMKQKSARASLNRQRVLEQSSIRQSLNDQKKAALAQQKIKSSWDFSGHRGLVDSTLVVAKYGAISQALFGIQNAMRAVGAEAIRFDQSIAQTVAVLDITGASAEDMSQKVVELGKRFGTDFEEIQTGMITLGRAGVENIEQLKMGTEGLAALSVITGDAMHYGASAMASMIAVYPQLSGVMDDLSNKMGEVANATRLGLEDFSTINNYALTTAKNIGMTSNTYLAFAGALSKVGLNASTIGTSMRRMDRIMSDSSKSVTALFRQMNMDQQKFAELMRTDSKQALLEFTNTLNKMDAKQFEKAVAGLPIRIKATIKSLKQLGQIGEGTGTILEEMFKKVEAPKDVLAQAEKNAVGLNAAMGRVGNTIKSAFTNELRSIMHSLFDTANIETFQNSINDAIAAVKTLTGVLGSLIGIYVGVRGAQALTSVAMDVLTAATWRQVAGVRAAITAWGKLGKISKVGIIGAGVVAASELGKYAITKAEESYSGVSKRDVERMQDEGRAAANRDTVAVTKDLTSEYQSQYQTLTAIKDAKTVIEGLNINEEAKRIAVKKKDEEILEIEKKRVVTQQHLQDLYSVEIAKEETKQARNAAKGVGQGITPGVPKLDDTGEEYLRRETVARAKLNGEYVRSVHLQKELTSLQTALSGLDADKVNEAAKLRMQIAEKELALKGAIQQENEKAARANKQGAGAAEKQAKAADREAKQLTKMSVLKAKIAIQEQKNAIIAKGGVITDKIKYQNELKILTATKEEAKAVYDAAKAREMGVQSIKATEEAYLKYLQAVGKEQEKMNEPLENMFESIADGLEEAFDAVMSGDINGAIKDLFLEMMKMGAKATLAAVANSELVAGSSAIAAIAKAASESTWVGMAAMAAAMAAIGAFSGSIGGAPSISEAEMTQATGGNMALSDSAENALEAIRENGVEGLEYSRRMADSLDIMVRQSDKASASLGDSLSGREYNPRNRDTLWGGSQREMVSTGIMINPASIDDFANANLTGWEYLTEKVTKSSWFGLSSKESLQTSSAGEADASFMQAYADAFNSGVDALRDAAEVLGVTKDQFTQFTSEWEMLSQNLNFEGLDADERTELIIQSLSANLDSLAETITPLVGYVDEFKQGGEGFAETVLRLANEFEVVERAMTNLGISMPTVANGGVAVSQAFIDIFGTMERFSGFMNWFTNGFFTDEERLTMATNQLKESFAQLGMTMPATREGMKALILLKLAEIKTITQQIEAQKALIKAQIAGSKITIEKAKIEGITAEAAADAAMVAGAGAMVAAGAAAEAVAILEQLEVTLEGLKDFISMIDANMENIDLVFDTGSFDSSVASAAGSLGSAAAGAGSMASSCGDAAQSAEDLAKAMDAMFMSVSGLKAEWMDDLAGAEMMVRMAQKTTGLMQVNYDNFLEEFQKAIDAAGGSMKLAQEEFDKWSTMSGYLKSYQSLLDAEDDKLKQAEEEKRQKELDWLNEQVSFYETLLKKIQNAYQGSLSYFNTMEKANYAAGQAAKAIEEGNTQEYINQLGKQLEAEKKMSTSKEDYVLEFEEYITELKKQKPEQTLDDVVDELVLIREEIDELKDSIRISSYQKVEA